MSNYYIDRYVVESRDGLVAAVNAAAQPTFEEARQNPCTIQLGSTTYKFKEGISEFRAKEIVANIRKVSARAFEIA